MDTERRLDLRRRLLWIDCSAGAFAGTIVLLFHSWFASFYALPEPFVLCVGAANAAYGAFSFSIAIRSVRPLILIRSLSLANMAWAAACLWWVHTFWGTASVFGLAHLFGEALLVGGLGCLEWRWQRELRTVGDQE